MGVRFSLLAQYAGLSASVLGEVSFKHLRWVRVPYPVQYWAIVQRKNRWLLTIKSGIVIQWPSKKSSLKNMVYARSGRGAV